MPKIDISRSQLIPLDHFSEADDYGKLVDGLYGVDSSLSYQPLNSNNVLTYPHRILINLQSEYTLEKIRYRDDGGSDTIQFFAGSTPFNLIQIGGDIVLNQYDVWRELITTLTGVTFIQIVLVTSIGRFPSEIEVWGTLTSTPFVEPSPQDNGYPNMWDILGTCGHLGGNNPVKMSDIFSIGRFYFDARYVTKLVSGTTKYRFDNSYQGGVSNSKIQAFKDNGLKVHLDVQYSPEWILNRNDYPDGFEKPNSNTLGTGFTQVLGSWGIIDNKAYCLSSSNTGSSVTNIVLNSVNKSDQYHENSIKVKLTYSSDTAIIIARYLDINNYLYLECKGDNTVRLWKMSSGTPVVISPIINYSLLGNEVNIILSCTGALQFFVGNTYGGYFDNSFNNNSSAVKIGFGVKSGAGLDGTGVRFEVAVHDDNYKPIKWDADPYQPSSYTEIAKFYYHLVGMYGNGSVPYTDLDLDFEPEYNHVQPAVSNLNLIYSIEVWNEMNKFWQGTYGWYEPYVYAAFISAVYDGHCNTLGSNVGIKSADPNMIVSTAGMVKIDLSYYKAIYEWAKIYRQDGSFPADVFNFHHYCNDGDGQFTGTSGIMPEGQNNNLLNKLLDADDWKNRYFPNKQIWLSEIGYDTNESIQKSPIIGSYDKEETQGFLLIRTQLIIAKSGIDKYMNFTFSDENDSSNSDTNPYTKSGVVTSEVTGEAYKKSWWYLREFNNIFKNTDYSFFSDDSNEIFNKYLFKNLDGDIISVCWSPTQNNTQLTGQTIYLPTGGTWSLAKSFTFNSYTSKTESNIPNDSDYIDTVSEVPKVYYYKISNDVVDDGTRLLFSNIFYDIIINSSNLKPRIIKTYK